MHKYKLKLRTKNKQPKNRAYLKQINKPLNKASFHVVINEPRTGESNKKQEYDSQISIS